MFNRVHEFINNNKIINNNIIIVRKIIILEYQCNNF